MKKSAFILMLLVFSSQSIYPQAPIDFETIGHDWSWTIFSNGDNATTLFSISDNPNSGGSNTSAHVAKYIVNINADPWAGIWSEDITEFVLSKANCEVKMWIYKESISDVDLKFENEDKTIVFEMKVPNTIVNDWEELTFDFSAHIGKTVSRIVIMPDFLSPKTEITNNYIDNISFNEGSIPQDAVPTPSVPAEKVISLFSNAYTNVAVNTWKTDWSDAAYSEVLVAGNDTKKYSNLNYAGIETTGANLIDASNMTHFHLDYYSTDITSFKVKLVDWGANGVWNGGGDDVEHELTFSAALSQWNSIDIPLSDFTNLTAKAHMAQYIISGTPLGEVYIDNFYFYNKTIPITFADVNVSSLELSPVSNIAVSGTGSLIIDQNTEVASVTVAAGGKLTINNGSTLTGTVTLESSETGTATLLDEYTEPTLTATVKQHVTAGRNWYMSAPVSEAPYTWLSRGTKVSEWNEATKLWDDKTSGNLVAGKGYVQVATSSPSVTGTTGSVDVSGITNSGDVVVTVSRTESGLSRGFNLTGNPYPSYLKWSGTNGFISDAANDSISTSFWYRTKNTEGAYIFTTYNGTSHLVVGGTTANTDLNEYIPPMQAFWIRVNENTGKTTHNVNLTFKNTMRVHGAGDNNKFKAPKADERQLVRLILANGSQSDEALIYFDAAAADTFDNYDSPKMLNNSSTLPDIYSTVGSDRLAINGLNELADNMELPLGFTLKAAVTGLKLKVNELSNFANGTKVYLFDKEENTQTELQSATEYTFNTTASVTNNESRFSLLFRAPGVTTGVVDDEKREAQVFVNAANQITILVFQETNYSIYNALGQQITTGIAGSNHQTTNIKVAAGIYVVKANNKTTRVIVK